MTGSSREEPQGIFNSESAFDLLPPMDDRERAILYSRFALTDGTPMKLQEIGTELGVTRERVRQLESKILRRIRSQNLELRQFMSMAITEPGVTDGLASAHQRIRKLLGNLSGSAGREDKWMAMLAKAYPEFAEVLRSEEAFNAGRKLLAKLMKISDRTIVYKRDFLDQYEDQGGSRAAAEAEWRELASKEPRMHWRNDAVVADTYKAIIRYVMLLEQREMHWKELVDTARRTFPSRDIKEQTMYNALLASDLFVYQRQGTYGLRELGFERMPFQKVTITQYLRDKGQTQHRYEVEQGVRALGHEIPTVSIMWYLTDAPEFYQDVDGRYGLREWLPPIEKQTLRTPRWLQESRKSNERRGPLSSRNDSSLEAGGPAG